MWPISIPMSMAISSIDSVGAFNQSKNTPTDKQTVGEDAVHSWKTELEIERGRGSRSKRTSEPRSDFCLFSFSRLLVFRRSLRWFEAIIIKKKCSAHARQ